MAYFKDYEAIKHEYITTELSYRTLAEKYGVNPSSLMKRGSEEGWVALREQRKSAAVAKIIEEESTAQAERMTRILAVSDKILSAIEKAVDSFLVEELSLDKGALKQLTGALKDIKDIQLIKDDSADSAGITVVFGDDVEEYSK